MPAEMQSEEDRRIAAMLLRNAREQVENAKEEGNSAYFADPRRGPGRVNERLLKGEVNQMKSFNKRAGVDCAKLPAMPDSAHATPLERERMALDREFVRRAHEIREGGSAKEEVSRGGGGSENKAVTDTDRDRQEIYKNFGSNRRAPDFGWGERAAGPCYDFAKGLCTRDNCRFSHDPGDAAAGPGLGRSEPPDPTQRKRQRVGAGGKALDLAAAEEEAARQADEELEFVNPLMRGPAVKKTPAGASGKAEKPAAPPKAPAKEAADCWASKKLRVRIVDESGKFKDNNLKKGVIRRVDSAAASVDVELEGDGGLLREVPQALLETVVSKNCKKVEIVRGSARGMLAELLQRDPKRNVAVVRLGRGNDCDELKLPLDDVCEYV
eukprot:TRINITY_DN71035_c0_g1_i1.p1 TRINITY_DN71035_c0_g1~~TRINITY_DN71035_c0_g1_i1.p1  ORF type:complete len:382 (+),score=99.77 TRINITY_DN71035_c0_g1_i1:171-1316(+)